MLGIFGPKATNIQTIREGLLVPEVSVTSQISILEKNLKTYQSEASSVRIPAEIETVNKIKNKINELKAKESLQEINLIKFLRARTDKKEPIWSIVNPLYSVDDRNGGIGSNGKFYIRNVNGAFWWINSKVSINIAKNKRFISNSFPVIPKNIKGIIEKFKCVENIEFIMVLYKPSDWKQEEIITTKDPAIIVSFVNDDKYYCAAIWGEDIAEIKSEVKPYGE